ncbi:mitochondrial glycine transporter A isoform X2 [Aplysia californica]|uniref:Mitochondrial glycine transporter n=1 Tax=Aplysia californica TaxID=6500 RepID=A0ABM0JAK5_APLCA|nr:mitochondrial glycine transporter A isoform X2 [Aplysia californica]
MFSKNIVVADYKSTSMDTILSSPLVKSFMAGAFSGTCSTVLFQPLDLVKTRLQKSVNLGSKLGMVGEIANVIRQERVFALWSGLVPSISRCVPGIGLYFTSLHWLQSTCGSESPHPLESVAMGASARALAGVAVLPFTVMKTRYESGDFHYRGLFQGMHSTYSKEGIRALYSGLAPTLLRDVPFSGIYLMIYRKLKALSSDGQTPAAPGVTFTNGVLAGSLASFVTQPADVIKTNVQLYPKKYGRLKTVALVIYNERGVLGFWRGFLPRTLRRTLMAAMAWTVYEEMMRACNIKT